MKGPTLDRAACWVGGHALNMLITAGVYAAIVWVLVAPIYQAAKKRFS